MRVLCGMSLSAPVWAQTKGVVKVPTVSVAPGLGQAGSAPIGALSASPMTPTLSPQAPAAAAAAAPAAALAAVVSAAPTAAPATAMPTPSAKSAAAIAATLASPKRVQDPTLADSQNRIFDGSSARSASPEYPVMATVEPGTPRRSGLSKPAASLDPAQDSLIKNHRSMERGRDLGSYIRAFDGNFGTGDFARSLVALRGKPGASWLDSGAGEGIATEQLMEDPGYEGLMTTAISYETSAKPGPRRRVLSGRFLQDIRQEELGSNDLVTDVIGVLAYTYDFMSDFRKLYDSLKPDGKLYVFMASSIRDFYGRDNKVLVDGRVMALGDFLQTIPGLDIKLVKTPLYDQSGADVIGEVWNLRVKRTPGAEPVWPQLETIYFREGDRSQGEMVPQRIFAVKGSHPGAKALDALAGEGRLAYAEKTRGQPAETFFDKFRSYSGLRNILMNRLARLGDGQSWAIEGPAVERVASELRTGVRFTDPSFMRPSQWLMEMTAKLVARKKLVNGAADKPTILVVDDGSASYRLDEDLERWVASVPDGGEIWLSLGDEKDGTGTGLRILTDDTHRLGPRGWLASIPGLEVTDYRGHRLHGSEHNEPVFVRIVVPDHSKVRIPKLTMLGAGEPSGDGVRIPLYREAAPR